MTEAGEDGADADSIADRRCADQPPGAGALAAPEGGAAAPEVRTSATCASPLAPDPAARGRRCR